MKDMEMLRELVSQKGTLRRAAKVLGVTTQALWVWRRAGSMSCRGHLRAWLMLNHPDVYRRWQREHDRAGARGSRNNESTRARL